MPDKPIYKTFPEFSGHELVKEFKDGATGVTSYITIHNTNLGAALGGTRIFNYEDNNQGLKDALKLSKAMTYKCAIAGVPFGGGKAVIVASPRQKNIFSVLSAHARNVKNLAGQFYTGADVGLSAEYVEYLGRLCPYIIGTKKAAGDPSPFAGLSAFLCAQAALKNIYGQTSSAGKTVAIKGVGKTGKKLAELFFLDGAKVFIADIDARAVKDLQKKFPGMRAINTADIFKQSWDIYCPCALSSDITKDNVKKIKTQIICGTANNQLGEESLAEVLFKQGIIHVPDYVANAGGLINVANELLPGGYSKQRVDQYLGKLKTTVSQILKNSRLKNINPLKIANLLAEEKFSGLGQKVVLPKKQKVAVL